MPGTVASSVADEYSHLMDLFLEGCFASMQCHLSIEEMLPFPLLAVGVRTIPHPVTNYAF
jgi:hypothetical protein